MTATLDCWRLALATDKGVTAPRTLLRAEALLILAALLVVQVALGGSWVLFVVFLLLPDLGIAAYRLGTNAGAATYNFLHFAGFAIAFGLYGLLADVGWAVSIATGWGAHIALDRVVGYGLKYRDDFKHTHVQNL